MSRADQGFTVLTAVMVLLFSMAGLSAAAIADGFASSGEELQASDTQTARTLADSCIAVAMLRLRQQYDYVPQQEGDEVRVGADSCMIQRAEHGPEINERKVVNISVSAHGGASYFRYLIAVSVANPRIAGAPDAPRVSLLWRIDS